MKLEILPDIHIKSPCMEDWDAMPGSEARRYCTICGDDVYELSEMSADEAAMLFSRRSERLCVRYAQRADGVPQFRIGPRWLHWTRRYLRRGVIAAAALFGMILTSTTACVMGRVKCQRPDANDRNASTQPAEAVNDQSVSHTSTAKPPRKLMGGA